MLQILTNSSDAFSLISKFPNVENAMAMAVSIKRKQNVELAARGDFGRIVSHLRVSMPGRKRQSSLRPLIKFPES
jgi:hypothetical protein